MNRALVNRRVDVPVEKFYRVFDGDDVIELGFVDQIDNGRQRGTLAAAGRPGHQDDPIFQFDDIAQLAWQVEVFEVRRLRWYDAHNDRIRAALLKDVDA